MPIAAVVAPTVFAGLLLLANIAQFLWYRHWRQSHNQIRQDTPLVATLSPSFSSTHQQPLFAASPVSQAPSSPYRDDFPPGASPLVSFGSRNMHAGTIPEQPSFTTTSTQPVQRLSSTTSPVFQAPSSPYRVDSTPAVSPPISFGSGNMYTGTIPEEPPFTTTSTRVMSGSRTPGNGVYEPWDDEHAASVTGNPRIIPSPSTSQQPASGITRPSIDSDALPPSYQAQWKS